MVSSVTTPSITSQAPSKESIHGNGNGSNKDSVSGDVTNGQAEKKLDSTRTPVTEQKTTPEQQPTTNLQKSISDNDAGQKSGSSSGDVTEEQTGTVAATEQNSNNSQRKDSTTLRPPTAPKPVQKAAAPPPLPLPLPLPRMTVNPEKLINNDLRGALQIRNPGIKL